VDQRYATGDRHHRPLVLASTERRRLGASPYTRYR